ncbi:MAG: M15 family metallopeptidase [Alphaproteobacteria bacterium]|nr:M15 family metallopeptidase [Alphaproteobacteria bacterium]
MSLGKRQEVFARDVAALLGFAFARGFEVRIGEAERTVAQQEIYVREGKSKTMASKHLDRLAVDLFFTCGGQVIWAREGLAALGEYWESLRAGNKWGGNFKTFLDTPHFEG